VLDKDGNVEEFGINTDGIIVGDQVISSTPEKYVNDSIGNWIKRTRFSWNILYSGNDRKIIYF
jgi:hypothetical protein